MAIVASKRALMLALACVVLACEPPVTPPPTAVPPSASRVRATLETTPLGRLPSGVRPVRYALELELVPDGERFRGNVRIDVELDASRDTIWMHGHGLAAESVSVEPRGAAAVAGRYRQVHDDGVAMLSLDRPVGPGLATIVIAYSGAYTERGNGLYRVKADGVWYAFTQMEPVWARGALPCFDEPAFKTPWDVTLIGHAEHRLIANTRETSRRDVGGGKVSVRFAATEPLPTYLLAWAAGPLDVIEAPAIAPNAVRKRPLPFRGVAARGRGKQMAYALEHTPAILAVLEDYFGIEYPYDKLDILAVPEKGGAMENAGAVTFREWLLLFDEATASIAQKRAFAGVMAHELAHQWFGNLVTMPWWDDIWLNEAFATWMGSKAVHRWRPDHQADISPVAGVHGAMEVDSLLSARQIRQPVERNDDIHAAFDQITYRKGGGVLDMFERWMTADQFREGVSAYMRAHRHGNATADDLLAALTKAAGKEVGAPFRTFLLQPGLPQVDVTIDCSASRPSLGLSQSRYLPIGSQGDAQQRWQIPMCVRYSLGGERREQCALLADMRARMPLEGEGCPDWVMPNADAAGYYQWSLTARALTDLVHEGMPKLTVREKMSVAASIWYGFARGVLPADEALSMLEPFAGDEHPLVATQPMRLLWQASDWLYQTERRAAVERYGQKLYRPILRRLTTTPKPGETAETQLLRRDVLSYLVFGAKDPQARKRSTELGRAYLGLGKDGKLHPEAVATDLAPIVVRVLGQDADPRTFEAMLALLTQSSDEDVRGTLLGGIAAVENAVLAGRARELTFDERLRVNETTTPLFGQLGQHVTRYATWDWLELNVDRVIARLPPRAAGWLPAAATMFCDESVAAAAEKLFAPRLASLPGGARELAKATETVRLCAARREAQLARMQKFFEQQR